MNLNLEILQFFVYKKIIDKKDIEEILPECDRLGLPVDRYLISHGYCNDIAATAALGEYYCMPYIEMDMLTVDEALIDTAELAYLKRHKIVPVSLADDGTLVAAVGIRPILFPCLPLHPFIRGRSIMSWYRRHRLMFLSILLRRYVQRPARSTI